MPILTDYTNLGGWIDDPVETERVMKDMPFPIMDDCYSSIKDSGKGKTVLLYDFVKKVTGSHQVQIQKIGDCLNAYAQVQTNRGLKSISEINIGDQVLTHKDNVKTVTNTIKKPYTKNLVKFTNKHSQISLTSDHLVLTEEGWKKAQDCKPYNTILFNNKYYSDITIGYDKVEDGYVYCLEVEDDHSFIANGFAVHNCVSFGAAHAIQALICTEIYLKKEKEKWVGQVATEPIYGGSRVQIGNGRLGSGDGSLGVWAAKFITDYGVLSRLVYDDYDLRQYSPTRAKQWGMPRAGCPRELWDDCREHPVGTSTKVTSVEQARDLIANGYAIGIAGNKGFSNRRDKYGIARASGSWAHMMSILGVDDDGSTAGGKKTMLVCNSWPYNWISGPTRFDQPPGSFWATYDDLEYYFVRGDSWAYSNFQGYPARPAYNIDIF